MPSRSIIRTGVGPHREPGNRFPAMAAINLLAARAARVQSRRNLSRSLSPKLDHSHSITRFDRSRTGPKSAALDVAAKGIRVNAICPGGTDAPMGDEIDPDAMTEFLKDQPIGRIGKSEEIAAAVLWLYSPGASFVLGVALPVDGGFVAH